MLLEGHTHYPSEEEPVPHPLAVPSGWIEGPRGSTYRGSTFRGSRRCSATLDDDDFRDRRSSTRSSGAGEVRRMWGSGGKVDTGAEWGAHFYQQGQPAQQGIFLDAAAMKAKIRAELLRPEYNVCNLYVETGVWQAIARSPYFEKLTLGVITFNAVWIAVDADYNTAPILLLAEPVYQIVEQFFCLYFAFEWLVRYCSFRRKLAGFRDGWFAFDSALVLSMVLETWALNLVTVLSAHSNVGGITGNVSILRLARLLRLLRLARMGRLLRVMPELLIMIKGILAATRAVLLTLALLGIMMYIFGIAFVQLTEGTDIGASLFGTVPMSMYTLLYTGTFLQNLTIVVDALGQESGVVIGGLFCAFVLLANITLLNMLIGVLCDMVHAVAETEEEKMTVAAMKDHLEAALKRQGLSMEDMIPKQGLAALLSDLHLVKSLEEDRVDVIGLIENLDFIYQVEGGEDGEERDLTFEEVFDLLLQLRGTNTATVKDIVGLRKYMSQMSRQLRNELRSSRLGDATCTASVSPMRTLGLLPRPMSPACVEVAPEQEEEDDEAADEEEQEEAAKDPLVSLLCEQYCLMNVLVAAQADLQHFEAALHCCGAAAVAARGAEAGLEPELTVGPAATRGEERAWRLHGEVCALDRALDEGLDELGWAAQLVRSLLPATGARAGGELPLAQGDVVGAVVRGALQDAGPRKEVATPEATQAAPRPAPGAVCPEAAEAAQPEVFARWSPSPPARGARSPLQGALEQFTPPPLPSMRHSATELGGLARPPPPAQAHRHPTLLGGPDTPRPDGTPPLLPGEMEGATPRAVQDATPRGLLEAEELVLPGAVEEPLLPEGRPEVQGRSSVPAPRWAAGPPAPPGAAAALPPLPGPAGAHHLHRGGGGAFVAARLKSPATTVSTSAEGSSEELGGHIRPYSAGGWEPRPAAPGDAEELVGVAPLSDEGSEDAPGPSLEEEAVPPAPPQTQLADACLDQELPLSEEGSVDAPPLPGPAFAAAAALPAPEPQLVPACLDQEPALAWSQEVRLAAGAGEEQVGAAWEELPLSDEGSVAAPPLPSPAFADAAARLSPEPLLAPASLDQGVALDEGPADVAPLSDAGSVGSPPLPGPAFADAAARPPREPQLAPASLDQEQALAWSREVQLAAAAGDAKAAGAAWEALYGRLLANPEVLKGLVEALLRDPVGY